MSSCISNSEAADAGARRWRGFVVAFLGAGLALLACLLGAVALLDPFDAGVFGEPHRGVADQAPRTADASRARDPAFDAAVFGNSHIQLVDPAALSRGNGLAFASLTVPGTGPREQLAMLDAFLRHHGGKPRALVFGIDPTWCVEDPALPITNPFPFWLYDPSPIAYLRGLARYAALEQAVRRIGLTIGLARPARRDGYWNYAVGRQPAYSAAVPAPADTPTETVIDDARRFPALDLLAERLAALPAEVAVVLVRPPVHASTLGPAGSTLARAEASCRLATRALLSRHAASALVDFRVDGPEARNPALWLDSTHYAEPLARKLELAVSAEIETLRQ